MKLLCTRAIEYSYERVSMQSQKRGRMRISIATNGSWCSCVRDRTLREHSSDTRYADAGREARGPPLALYASEVPVSAGIFYEACVGNSNCLEGRKLWRIIATLYSLYVPPLECNANALIYF